MGSIYTINTANYAGIPEQLVNAVFCALQDCREVLISVPDKIGRERERKVSAVRLDASNQVWLRSGKKWYQASYIHCVYGDMFATRLICSNEMIHGSKGAK